MAKKSTISSKPKVRITLIITYTAILTALSVICNMYSIPIADGTKNISFTYLPSMIAGSFLGPIPGFAVGALGDGLGQIISPKGIWIPTITLSSGLLGLIPGLIHKIPKLNDYIKIILSYILCFAICSFLINTLSTYKVYVIDKGGSKSFWFYTGERLGLTALVVFINCIINCIIYYPLKRFVFDKLNNKVATDADIIEAESPAYEAVQSDLTADKSNIIADDKNNVTKNNF